MANDVRLLTNWTQFGYTPDMIKESREKHNGKLVMKGILQKAETLNQNGRVYPRPILEREIRNYQKFIKENRALGECDHPDSSVVELKKVSHIIREARMEGDVCYGTVELLDTPAGKILQSLVESGVTLGISSRGVGSTKRDGDLQIVQDDFQLICWDFVAEPSTPGAFMMAEGKKIDPNELKRTFTKEDRLDRIFNDIIGWRSR
jgi:hypothetical protein